MQRAFAFPTRRFAATAAAAAEGRNQGAASQKAERNKPFAIWALWALFSLLVLASFFIFFCWGWGNLICNSHESRLICGKSKRQQKGEGGGGLKDKAAQLVQLFKMFLFRH